MRYFIDTEFAETGDRVVPTIDLISIGIVAQDGGKFYAESNEFSLEYCDDWVKKNVLSQLGPPEQRLSRAAIAAGVLEFIGNDSDPEFWAYFADYDWVVLCWLWGKMVDLPKGFPMMCMDLQQWYIQLGRPPVKPQKPEANRHNALADAHWNKEFHDALSTHSANLRASQLAQGLRY